MLNCLQAHGNGTVNELKNAEAQNRKMMMIHSLGWAGSELSLIELLHIIWACFGFSTSIFYAFLSFYLVFIVFFDFFFFFMFSPLYSIPNPPLSILFQLYSFTLSSSSYYPYNFLSKPILTI